MEEKNRTELKQLLQALSENLGFFVMSADGFYCQFAKDAPENPIQFEAISAYYSKTLKKDPAYQADLLDLKFSSRGFNLEPKGNYTKQLQWLTTDALDSIVEEVEYIFENLYRLASNTEYTIENEIEMIS